MSRYSQQLREKAAKIHAEMKRMNDEAEKNGRSFAETAREAYQRAQTDLKATRDEYKAVEAREAELAEVDAEFTSSNGRRSEAPEPGAAASPPVGGRAIESRLAGLPNRGDAYNAAFARALEIGTATTAAQILEAGLTREAAPRCRSTPARAAGSCSRRSRSASASSRRPTRTSGCAAWRRRRRWSTRSPSASRRSRRTSATPTGRPSSRRRRRARSSSAGASSRRTRSPRRC